ncbi:hypothetical protein CO180_03740 [candidate division WWE3 bacterium CG_4_9_14_3_um_filter_41_6]|uniref:L,D-TPase catalytic domain-containing protein n=1 Tax=candidate division WWE3 bacterium CG_4_10_14_0_2_um_filter_41_14 TaxID=1975072 RepID=A0A2M7TGC7_UNCKA|nr:MAG: hypothetical protein COY32_06090 [candidate division WWE3 bacterium CG_4_10_14_0_2_um_filter_41_14]PJA38342.1 MAG: hypothetical protein CO180_03740 [candidate division WWE3 bacterium CG_4_9_14_3_um_filter_41_6]
MNRTILPRFTRYLIYPLAILLSISVVLGAQNIADQSKQTTALAGQSQQEYELQLPIIRTLQTKRYFVQSIISQIDPMLPSLSTTEIDLLIAAFDDSLLAADYERAHSTLEQAQAVAKDTLANQAKIADQEVTRLLSVLTENIAQIDHMLGNKDVIPATALELLSNDTVDVMARLNDARGWVEVSAHEIKRRRATLDTAQKQIVIVKSEKSLHLYENGEIIYSMPVSLGRPSAITRTGDFAILDKLGTVWSYWQIWLPKWLGIYYAGSSENGIHGLPFDNYGNVYWTAQVGTQNITYGCVMPNDPNMAKLYDWAEVGIPVAIVD